MMNPLSFFQQVVVRHNVGTPEKAASAVAEIASPVEWDEGTEGLSVTEMETTMEEERVGEAVPDATINAAVAAELATPLEGVPGEADPMAITTAATEGGVEAGTLATLNPVVATDAEEGPLSNFNPLSAFKRIVVRHNVGGPAAKDQADTTFSPASVAAELHGRWEGVRPSDVFDPLSIFKRVVVRHNINTPSQEAVDAPPAAGAAELAAPLEGEGEQAASGTTEIAAADTLPVAVAAELAAPLEGEGAGQAGSGPTRMAATAVDEVPPVKGEGSAKAVPIPTKLASVLDKLDETVADAADLANVAVEESPALPPSAGPSKVNSLTLATAAPTPPSAAAGEAGLEMRLAEELKEDREGLVSTVLDAEKLRDEAASLGEATGAKAAAEDPAAALLAARAGVVELRGEIDAVLDGLRRAEQSDDRLSEDFAALFKRLEEQESRGALVEAALADVQRESAVDKAQAGEVSRLESRAAEKDAELVSLKLVLKERDGQITALTSEIASLQDQVSEQSISRDVDDAFVQLEEMRSQLEDLSAAQVAIELRDEEIATLGNLVSGLEDAVDAKEAERAAAEERATEALSIRGNAADLEKKALQAELALASREKEVERLQRAVAERDGRLAQSVALVKEMRDYVKEACI